MIFLVFLLISVKFVYARSNGAPVAACGLEAPNFLMDTPMCTNRPDNTWIWTLPSTYVPNQVYQLRVSGPTFKGILIEASKGVIQVPENYKRLDCAGASAITQAAATDKSPRSFQWTAPAEGSGQITITATVLLNRLSGSVCKYSSVKQTVTEQATAAPTNAPPTNAPPPTNVGASPTNAAPTNAAPTDAAPTNAAPTDAAPGNAPTAAAEPGFGVVPAMAGLNCDAGDRGCSCDPRGRCVESIAQCLGSRCVVLGCVIGELGCACHDDESCSDGHLCRMGFCVRRKGGCDARLGSIGCVCTSEDVCVESSHKCEARYCRNARTYTCVPGEMGCWCKDNEFCNGDDSAVQCVQLGLPRKLCVFKQSAFISIESPSASESSTMASLLVLLVLAFIF